MFSVVSMYGKGFNVLMKKRQVLVVNGQTEDDSRNWMLAREKENTQN